MRNLSIVLAAAAMVVLSAQGLFAQAQGFSGNMLGGGGGGGGGSGMGGSSFGSGGMSGGSGMGMGSSTGMGSSSTGGLTMMSAASLSGGFGMLGFGSMNGFGSSTGGSSMYGGRAYGAVTQAGGGTSTGSRSTSSGGSGSSGSGSGGGGAAGSSNRRRTGAQSANTASKEQQAWFQPRIEIGFDVTTPQVSAIASSVATSLGASKPGSRFRGVQVAFEGGTAILRGVVATQNDRILAEQIALLEPSVSGVRNDLTIASRPSPATRQ